MISMLVDNLRINLCIYNLIIWAQERRTKKKEEIKRKRKERKKKSDFNHFGINKLTRLI